MKSDELVAVENLCTYFPVENGPFGTSKATKNKFVKAVDGVSFTINRGEIVALVGESGCGKTTVGKTMVMNNVPTSGSIRYTFGDISATLNAKHGDSRIRRYVQYIFQDPYSSLNPRMRIRTIVERPMDCFGLHQADREQRIRDLILTVGLSEEQLDRFPHEFSGGQKQRISIARALAAEPQFIIADEPTAALDVSIQGQILNLLLELRNRFDLTILFVTHDLGIVQQIADRVLVMYLGNVVETGTTEEVFFDPKHPYTQALIGAMPLGPVANKGERIRLNGSIPSPIDLPSGCRLHQRCPFAEARCMVEEPNERMISDTRRVRCHLVPEQ